MLAGTFVATRSSSDICALPPAQHAHLLPRRCAPVLRASPSPTRTPFSLPLSVSVAIAAPAHIEPCKDRPQSLQRPPHDHLSLSPFHLVGAFFVRHGSPLSHATCHVSSCNVSRASATRSCSSAGNSRTSATTSSSRLVIGQLYHAPIRPLGMPYRRPPLAFEEEGVPAHSLFVTTE